MKNFDRYEGTLQRVKNAGDFLEECGVELGNLHCNGNEDKLIEIKEKVMNLGYEYVIKRAINELWYELGQDGHSD